MALLTGHAIEQVRGPDTPDDGQATEVGMMAAISRRNGGSSPGAPFPSPTRPP